MENKKRIDSPLENWPGYIVVPVELSPEQFDIWWQAMQAQADDDPRHDFVQMWETRSHMILEWGIDGFDSSKVTDDVTTLPSMKLMNWINLVTGRIIREAQSFPNSPAPLSDGTKPAAPDEEE